MKSFIVLSIFLTLVTSKLFAITGEEIIKKSEEAMTPKTSYSISEQIIYTTSGLKRVLKMRIYQKNGNENMLMEYIEPARVRGDKFLFAKDSIWVYFSKTGRTRRIASSAKKASMQGSDFSYEDMSMMSDMSDDYNAELKEEEKFQGRECFVVELIPKDRKISYQKLLCWIDKKNFVSLKMDFYKENAVVKRLIQKNVKKFGKYFMPMVILMESLKKDTKTEIRNKEIEVDLDIPDSKFKLTELTK